jgi:multidrug resistance efflux pump
MNKRTVWLRLSGEATLYALALLSAVAAAWAYHTPIEVVVQAKGIVRPDGQTVQVTTEIGGRISKVCVAEGDEVRQGDVLVQLDTRELAAKRRKLQSQIHFAELRLAALRELTAEALDAEHQSVSVDQLQDRAGEESSRAGLDQARARFMQTDQLFREGLVSKQAFEDARVALDRARADYSKWSANLGELKRAQSEVRLRERENEVASARTDLAMLYEQLRQHEFEFDRLTITSPTNGRITSMAPVHPGEVTTPGTSIAALIPRDRILVIESWIPSGERDWVKEGQRVRAKPDELHSDPARSLDGVVLSISPDARITDTLATHRVLIRIVGSSLAVHLGQTFQVRFITREQRLLWVMFQRIYDAFH